MTKAQFYNIRTMEGQARERSREIDFGVWWYGKNRFPTYRVTWVEATGEIISVSASTLEYTILGRIKKEDEVEKTLKGWAKKCGSIDSLQWVKDQLG